MYVFPVAFQSKVIETSGASLALKPTSIKSVKFI